MGPVPDDEKREIKGQARQSAFGRSRHASEARQAASVTVAIGEADGARRQETIAAAGEHPRRG